ncbi:MMPL family transporter [Glycomyces sp. MUSA5-2]|uniref:MMPL family transporter n=1 Tax=Glycomyces sp. MUSA5-2 TaxID=2053002 RepID=UPI00300B87D1
MSAVLARLGRFAARRRALTLTAWLLALAAAAVLTLTGMRFSDGSFDVPGTDSSRAMQTLETEFPETGEETASLQLVAATRDGSAITADDLDRALEALQDVPHVTAVGDPFDPAQPYVSADGTTAVAQITFGDMTESESEQAAEAVGDIAAELRAAGLTAEVGGSLTNPVPEILGPTEIVGAVIAFAVLLLTFGSLVAAGANMLGALLGVGVGILGVLAFSALVPIGSITPVLAVMLGLAVGIDYCLFILARFRSELRAGRTVDDAIGRASATAGSSVVFAGATVIIALAGLTVVGIPFIGEMGLAAAFAVAVAVLMSLTLLPAMMSWMGRRALPRKERRGAEAPHPQAGRLGRTVTRRPLIALAASTAVAAVLAIPVLHMSTALAVPGGEDPDSTQRAAYDLVADEFGAGMQDPLVLLVQTDGPVADELDGVVAQVSGLDGVAMAIPTGVADSGEAAMVTVFAETGPLDDATVQLVHDLRSLDIDGAELAVTGSTAVGLDSDEQINAALVRYLAIIVGLSLVLMMILFRSVLLPLIATGGFLLSLGAGLGASVAVFQWGWLDAVIQAPQGNPLLSLLPILVTGILFGLAMDYQVFLVSRMQEAHRLGMSPREAVRAGFAHSATVVAAAAAIMAAVFGGFALSGSSLVGSIALALAVGVLVDAFVVRMIAVPAAIVLLGNVAWWMPAWLDRLLPRLDVEGAGGEEAEVAEPAAAR